MKKFFICVIICIAMILASGIINMVIIPYFVNDEDIAQFDEEIETVNEEISIEEELALEFTLESGTGFGKKLENAWKADKENPVLNAMYHYHNANFYEAIGKIDMAKNEMKNISPFYNGLMYEEIINYGTKFFETIEIWEQENLQKIKHKELINNEKRQEIKDWIENRYNYYDKLEGKYCGDKYTNTIFNEASEKYGFTYQEISNIWADLPI